MIVTDDHRLGELQADTIHMLHELQIGVHRLGYRHLFVAIPCYAMDNSQSMSKELYPYIAEYYGYSDWHRVEHAIRVAIMDAWERRDWIVWEHYFPGLKKPPTNKRFIATLAERLR